MTARACSLSGFEIATGMVIGTVGSTAALPPPTGCTPLHAIEQAILPALLRPPCLISFSGGRDSSGVLAAATALARREGLATPIPITNVFRHAPATNERGWQERVVRHLDVTEWLRIEHAEELDLIGPYAQRVLRRHGLVWPFNVHFHLPLLDAARGGSLLTGIGGDELFGAARQHPIATLLAGARRGGPRDLLRLGLAYAPAAVRTSVNARREPLAFPWLRPRAQRRAAAGLAGWGAGQPWRLRERLAWVRSSRYLKVVTKALRLLADETNVLLVHPLLSSQVWTEVAAVGHPVGFSSRTNGMRRVFAQLLPDEICARGSKARFDDAFWTRPTRDFVRSWDGSGAPEDWVDPAALADHWRQDPPCANSFTLLQAVWLASDDRGQQSLGDFLGQVPATRSLQVDHRQRAQLDQRLGPRRVQARGSVLSERSQAIGPMQRTNGGLVPPA
jgi:Asparagine synthase